MNETIKELLVVTNTFWNVKPKEEVRVLVSLIVLHRWLELSQVISLRQAIMHTYNNKSSKVKVTKLDPA